MLLTCNDGTCPGSCRLRGKKHSPGEAALAPWRKPRTVHDPGKVLLDIALATAPGGDCPADVAMLRAEPPVFGRVASDPTVSPLVDVLAAAGPEAITAIRTARAEVRWQVRELAGADGPAAESSPEDGVLGIPRITAGDHSAETRTGASP